MHADIQNFKYNKLDFVTHFAPTPEKPMTMSELPLPYVVRNKTICAPGVWNGFFFEADTIKSAVDKTEWSKENRSLYLDHKDKDVSQWVGDVTNVHFDTETGTVKGDLCFVDPATAFKIAYGAKFGISPSIEADHNSHVVDQFLFRNFAVVIEPAMLKNYINNSRISKQNYAKWTTKYVNDLPDSAFAWIEPGGEKDEENKTTPRSLRHLPYRNHLGEIDLPHVRNALARLNQVKGMPENEQTRVGNMLEKILEHKKEFATEDDTMDRDPVEILADQVKELKTEFATMKENYQKEFDVTDDEMLDFAGNSSFADFVAKMRKENPKMSLKEIAKEWKKQKGMDNEKSGPEEPKKEEPEKKTEEKDEEEEDDEMDEKEKKKKESYSNDEGQVDNNSQSTEPGKQEGDSEKKPEESKEENKKEDPKKEETPEEKKEEDQDKEQEYKKELEEAKSKITSLQDTIDQLKAELQSPEKQTGESGDKQTKAIDTVKAFAEFLESRK